MGFKSVDLSGFHARGRASVEPEAVTANPQKAKLDKMKALLDRYESHCGDFFQFGTSPGQHSLNDPKPRHP